MYSYFAMSPNASVLIKLAGLLSVMSGLSCVSGRPSRVMLAQPTGPKFLFTYAKNRVRYRDKIVSEATVASYHHDSFVQGCVLSTVQHSPALRI